MLLSFKYHQRPYLRHQLADHMISFIQSYNLDINQFDSIVPIPLFSSKLRERGYNQAQLLAQIIAQKYKINLSGDNLIRVKNTSSQSSLSQKERWTNIHGAFRIKYSYAFRGKALLLIDDLMTTGSTASEAAGVLKSCKASKVGILTLAITL